MKFFLSALLLGFSISNAQILEVSQVFNKKLVKVQKEQIGTLKSFYGHMAINESKVYDIVSRFDGYVTKLYANEQYKFIKKGETLFSLYSDEINSISQEIQIAKKFNNSLISSNLEKLKSLNLNSIEINKIKNSKKAIENISFYSPSNSMILQKNINDGSFVKKGNLLLQLVSLDELWFIASVYQKDLDFIRKGMKAKIFVDGIKNPIESFVDTIYPTVDLKTKTIDVRFIIKNDKLNLYPNMFAKVSLKEESREILTLPKTAVLNKGSKYFVFQTLSKTEIEPIEIKVKRVSSNKYEILEGLDEGQVVINNALFLLDSDAITNGLYSSDNEEW